MGRLHHSDLEAGAGVEVGGPCRREGEGGEEEAAWQAHSPRGDQTHACWSCSCFWTCLGEDEMT